MIWKIPANYNLLTVVFWCFFFCLFGSSSDKQKSPFLETLQELTPISFSHFISGSATLAFPIPSLFSHFQRGLPCLNSDIFSLESPFKLVISKHFLVFQNIVVFILYLSFFFHLRSLLSPIYMSGLFSSLQNAWGLIHWNPLHHNSVFTELWTAILWLTRQTFLGQISREHFKSGYLTSDCNASNYIWPFCLCLFN